mgnify:CR=1 FL=1|tara:strand:+ start:607 stop:1125 length:519 start_codon:yes stop_codon:yes gene_type:complete
MKNGKHIVRGGFSELYDIVSGDIPRRIPLANGDFEKNFRLKDLRLMPASTDRAAGNQNDMSRQTVFFQLSVTPTGCLPISGTTENHDSHCLRFDDPAVIGWGCVQGDEHTFVIYDETILIDDVYFTAWSLTNAGTIRQGCAYGIGYYMEFEQVKNSGTEGIVYAYREYQESL